MLAGSPVLRAPDGELVVTVTVCVLLADMSELEELGPLTYEHTSHAIFAGGVSDCACKFGTVSCGVGMRTWNDHREYESPPDDKLSCLSSYSDKKPTLLPTRTYCSVNVSTLSASSWMIHAWSPPLQSCTATELPDPTNRHFCASVSTTYDRFPAPQFVVCHA